jgi:hypothetical protein
MMTEEFTQTLLVQRTLLKGLAYVPQQRLTRTKYILSKSVYLLRLALSETPNAIGVFFH